MDAVVLEGRSDRGNVHANGNRARLGPASGRTRLSHAFVLSVTPGRKVTFFRKVAVKKRARCENTIGGAGASAQRLSRTLRVCSRALQKSDHRGG
jgi:hypothetical protein